MKTLANLLIVLGVCFGALGASGFHTPIEDTGVEDPAAREDYALLYFLVGLALIGAGGGLSKLGGAAGKDETAGRSAALQGVRDELQAVQARLAELTDARSTADEAQLRTDLDDLLAGAYFDLTSQSDDIIALLGFDAYARVWEGVANAERLIARAWSMSTDGHHAEAIEELPIARENLDRAVAEMAKL